MSRHGLVVAVALMGCAPQGAPATGQGITVGIGETGGLSLSDTDRVLWSLAARGGITLVQAEETWVGPAGIWSFDRTELRSWVLDTVESVETVDDVVTVTLRGVGGVGAVVTVADRRQGATVLTITPVDAPDATAIRLGVRCEADATFHGWGEQYNATDQRGEIFDLFVSEQGIGRTGESLFTGDQHTTYFPMPYALDARGVGMLLGTEHRTLVDLCASDPGVATMEVTDAGPLEVVVLHGPTPLDVIRQLGDEVGRPDQPPSWAWETWIAAQGGTDDVRGEIARLEAADVPYGAIWSQDWTGPRPNLGGGFGVQYRWAADEEHYPGLKQLIDDLHDDGKKFLAYANPFIDADLEDHFPQMDDGGLLIRDEAGDSYTFFAPNGTSSHPDLSNPATEAYVQAALTAMVDDLEIDGWMVDFAEWTPLDAVVFDGSDPRAFHNRFPTLWQAQTRAVMEATRPDGDFAYFARSGWTGTQAVSQIHWVGDQEATWEPEDGLPTVVPAMLNLGLSGVPFVTHDIAGFSGGPSGKELYQRWTELGAFTPIMRTHDGDNKDDNWAWDSDAETTAHFRRMARIHDLLAPTWQALANEAAATGAPLVRHLMLTWPDDPATWPLSDQYTIGDDLLVAPVVQEGATSRRLYLPAGTWFHLWTGDAYEGGRTLTIPAPIGEPPVFALGEDRPEFRAIE